MTRARYRNVQYQSRDAKFGSHIELGIRRRGSSRSSGVVVLGVIAGVGVAIQPSLTTAHTLTLIPSG